MSQTKRTIRDANITVKKAVRAADGTSVGDRIGNAGDEVRKDLGNLGDDIHDSGARKQPNRPA